MKSRRDEALRCPGYIVLTVLVCILGAGIFPVGSLAQEPEGLSGHSRDIIEFLRNKRDKERNAAVPLVPGRVGYVDVLTVLLFHPSMADYSVSDNRFELTVPKDVPDSERGEYMKKLVDEHQLMVEDVERKLAETEEKYQKTDVRITLARQELNDRHQKLREQYQHRLEDAPESGKEKVRNEWREEVKKLEEDFFTTNKSLKIEREKLKRRIQEFNDELQKASFSTRKYTMEKFQEMFDDINEAIDEVAGRNEVDLVFNQSVTTVYYPEEKESVVYDNAYRMFLDGVRQGGKKREETLKHYGPVQLDFWYGEKSRVFRNLIIMGLDQVFYRIILKGGMDLTGEVLQYVLDKHRVDFEVQKVILKLFG